MIRMSWSLSFCRTFLTATRKVHNTNGNSSGRPDWDALYLSLAERKDLPAGSFVTGRECQFLAILPVPGCLQALPG